MKTTLSLILCLLLTFAVSAESPEKMSYQAIVRNTKGALVVNQIVGMKISIQKWVLAMPKPYYSTIYAETQTPATNENGLISIAIGTGTIVEGSILFKDIDWASELLYLKTEIDPSGGTTHTITSTTQLLSVPYALHAKTSENLTPLKIGDSYQGGIIFWLDDTGRHGLIASIADQSTGVIWGSTTFATTTGDGIYAGEMNTTLIIATEMISGKTKDIAARFCADYEATENRIIYGDWYLPSLSELQKLNLQKTVVGNFSENVYWSSTEANDEQVRAILFGTGVTGISGKGLKCSVRAIRRF